MRALDAVGPELSQVLVDICCELKGLEEAERSHDWPQRAGKVVLQLGSRVLPDTTGSMSERSASATEGYSPLGERGLPADVGFLARLRRSVNRGCLLDRLAGVFADSLDHGEQTV